jgi:hypothetical protein
MQRHGRQARLAEVGAEGQARIGRLAVDLDLEGFAADVAVRYLAGAGVGMLRVRDGALAEAARAIDPAVNVATDARLAADGHVCGRSAADGHVCGRSAADGHVCGRSAADDAPLDLPLNDPSARELARGALRALRALRSALDEEA